MVAGGLNRLAVLIATRLLPQLLNGQGVVLCVLVAAGESCGGTTTTAALLFNDIVLIVGLPVLECFVN